MLAVLALSFKSAAAFNPSSSGVHFSAIGHGSGRKHSEVMQLQSARGSASPGSGYLRRYDDKAPIDAAAVENLLSQRSEARRKKEWALSDSLRDELLEMGISINDRKRIWYVKFEEGDSRLGRTNRNSGDGGNRGAYSGGSRNDLANGAAPAGSGRRAGNARNHRPDDRYRSRDDDQRWDGPGRNGDDVGIRGLDREDDHRRDGRSRYGDDGTNRGGGPEYGYQDEHSALNRDDDRRRDGRGRYGDDGANRGGAREYNYYDEPRGLDRGDEHRRDGRNRYGDDVANRGGVPEYIYHDEPRGLDRDVEHRRDGRSRYGDDGANRVGGREYIYHDEPRGLDRDDEHRRDGRSRYGDDWANHAEGREYAYHDEHRGDRDFDSFDEQVSEVLARSDRIVNLYGAPGEQEIDRSPSDSMQLGAATTNASPEHDDIGWAEEEDPDHDPAGEDAILFDAVSEPFEFLDTDGENNRLEMIDGILHWLEPNEADGWKTCTSGPCQYVVSTRSLQCGNVLADLDQRYAEKLESVWIILQKVDAQEYDSDFQGEQYGDPGYDNDYDYDKDFYQDDRDFDYDQERYGRRGPWTRAKDCMASLTIDGEQRMQDLVDQWQEARWKRRYAEEDDTFEKLRLCSVGYSVKLRQWRADQLGFVYDYTRVGPDMGREDEIKLLDELVHLRGIASSRRNSTRVEELSRDLADLGVGVDDLDHTWHFLASPDPSAPEPFRRKLVVEDFLENHDYIQVDGDEIELERKTLQEIERLLRERLRAALSGNMRRLRDLQNDVLNLGLVINDRRREWFHNDEVWDFIERTDPKEVGYYR